MRVTDLPDLSDWRTVEVWTIDEAALLWAAIDPLEMKSGNFDEYIDGVPFDFSLKQARKAKICRKAIIEAVCGGTLPFSRAIELHHDYQNGDWEKEVPFPDLPDPEKIITSRTRVQQAAFMKWAKSKNIPSYREQITRANALAKNKEFVDSLNEISKPADTQPLALPAPSYLDPKNPRSPVELRASIEVWEIVTAEGESKNGTATKDRLRAELDAHSEYGALSNEAKSRITTVANWNKKGGAPKTPE